MIELTMLMRNISVLHRALAQLPNTGKNTYRGVIRLPGPTRLAQLALAFVRRSQRWECFYRRRPNYPKKNMRLPVSSSSLDNKSWRRFIVDEAASNYCRHRYEPGLQLPLLGQFNSNQKNCTPWPMA